jgi:hypothetical protein
MPVRAAVAARQRAQGRLRAVTVAIGAASVLTGGGIALGLPGTASAAAHSQTSTSTGSATSGTSSSGGLKSTAAPTFVSGSSQVTSGGS